MAINKIAANDLVNAMVEAATIIHEEAIKRILDGIPPPLTPKRIKEKGSSKPLIHEGWLLGALTEGFRVTEEGNSIKIEIGIFDEAVAKYAAVHEFGTIHVPQRAFLRPAFDSKIDDALKILEERGIEIIINKLK